MSSFEGGFEVGFPGSDIEPMEKMQIQPEMQSEIHSDFGVINAEEDNIFEYTEIDNFIKEEIGSHEITLDNYEEVEKDILSKAEENRINPEDAEEILGARMAIILMALDKKLREKLKETPGGRKEIYKADELEISCADTISKHIVELRNNHPEKIREYWADYCNLYEQISETEKYFAESRKYGILAELASADLIKSLGKEIKQETGLKVKLETENSTPEEDIKDKIDFWVTINHKNGIKKIPCQVKCLDISGRDSKNKQDYVRKNIVNFSKPDNSRMAFEYHEEGKINEFFRKNSEGVFIILPRHKGQIIGDNGKVNKEITKLFKDKIKNDPLFTKVFTDISFYSSK